MPIKRNAVYRILLTRLQREEGLDPSGRMEFNGLYGLPVRLLKRHLPPDVPAPRSATGWPDATVRAAGEDWDGREDAAEAAYVEVLDAIDFNRALVSASVVCEHEDKRASKICGSVLRAILLNDSDDLSDIDCEYDT